MTGRIRTDAELRGAVSTPAVLPADRPSPAFRSACAGCFTMSSSSFTAMPLSPNPADQLQHANLSPQSAPPHCTGAAAGLPPGDSPTAKGYLACVPTANVAQRCATMAGFVSAVSISTSTPGSTGGSPNPTAAALASGGLSRQLAAAAPQLRRLSASVQESADPAPAAPAFQTPTAVVTSPSLTSLAERAAAVTSSGDLDEAPAATGHPQRPSHLPSSAGTDQQSAVVPGGSLADPAITSGFRLTGFRVPSSELGESVSGSSTAGAGCGIPILEPAGKARRRASFEAGQLPSARPAAEVAVSSATDAAAAVSLLTTPPARSLRSCEGSPRSSSNASTAPGAAAERIEAAPDETMRPLPLPMSPPELEPPSRNVIAAMAAASEQQEGASGSGAPTPPHLSGRSDAEREPSPQGAPRLPS